MPEKRTTPHICEFCGRAFDARVDVAQRFCSRRCKARSCHPPAPLVDRLAQSVHRGESCWGWTGPTASNGYGIIRIILGDGRRKWLRTHRLAWFLATGHWPNETEKVCHDCPGGDNRLCVRNDTIGTHIVDGIVYEKRGHLWLGTNDANMTDMVEKERAQRGERRHNAKLTSETVKAIRSLYTAGGETHRSLGARFGVDYQTIGKVLRREQWKHVH